ncbi:chaperone modulator CbpM [Stutzerimonas kirkiae]|nr:chaperone modulator CbpM [Stutzerimonas kirkiae]
MSTHLIIYLSLEECCRASELPTEALIELVEYGVVSPSGRHVGEWRFDEQALGRLRQARRLQRDLELDWATTALMLELLGEMENLRDENRYLRRRLERFSQ